MAPKGIPIYLRLIQQQQKKIAKLTPVTKTRFAKKMDSMLGEEVF